MGKSLSSGINWSDVTYLWEGLQNIHECVVELTVLAAGGIAAHSLDFTVSAWVPTVEPQKTKTIAVTRGTWPDKEHPTFDSCIFNALYTLDRVIGRNYEQKEIQT